MYLVLTGDSDKPPPAIEDIGRCHRALSTLVGCTDYCGKAVVRRWKHHTQVSSSLPVGLSKEYGSGVGRQSHILEVKKDIS